MLELNKLHLMDCQKGMKGFPDNYFNFAIVDVPYGLERFKNGIGKNDRHKIKTKNTLWNNNKPSKEYFQELRRISKYQIIWGANNFELEPTEYFLIWNKMQTVDNFSSAEYAWTNYKMPAKVFNYSIHLHNKTNKIHPTQKPIALYKWILKSYCKKGDKIIDTHVGSGSSIIAFIDEGFDYIGFEIDKDYFDAATHRINEFKKQGKLFN